MPTRAGKPGILHGPGALGCVVSLNLTQIWTKKTQTDHTRRTVNYVLRVRRTVGRDAAVSKVLRNLVGGVTDLKVAAQGLGGAARGGIRLP